MAQVTTITLFKLSDFSAKVWAFFMMQFGHKALSNVPGQEFYKLMGSGKGRGFNPWPDWSTYALLQIWEKENHANQFFETSSFYRNYRNRAEQSSTIYLRNIASHGTWDQQKPFTAKPETGDETAPRMILTRATIRPSKLRKFWNYVPTSEKPIKSAEGLIYTKGVGEWPLTQMATLSIWQNEASMMAFAYQSEEHKKAIKLTKELDWYKEELFARFVPYKVQGDFKPLEELASVIYESR